LILAYQQREYGPIKGCYTFFKSEPYTILW
jgi:hypothetical protein